MILLDFACDLCGHTFESLEARPAPETTVCPRCLQDARRVLSAVAIGTVYATAVSRGKSDEVPPGAIDTRPLAEGMSRAEWKKLRRAGRRDEVRAGLVDRKVYV